DRASDGEHAVKWGDPPPNRGVLKVIAGMTPFRGEPNPTEFFVRPFLTALPCVAGEMRQRFERFHALIRTVVLAVAVLPSWCDGFGQSWRRFRFGRLDEAQARLHLCSGRFALQHGAIEKFNASFG